MRFNHGCDHLRGLLTGITKARRVLLIHKKTTKSPPNVRCPFKPRPTASQSTPLQFNFIKTEHEYFY